LHNRRVALDRHVVQLFASTLPIFCISVGWARVWAAYMPDWRRGLRDDAEHRQKLPQAVRTRLGNLQSCVCGDSSRLTRRGRVRTCGDRLLDRCGREAAMPSAPMALDTVTRNN